MNRNPQDGFSAFDFGALTRALSQAAALAKELHQDGVLTSEVVELVGRALATAEQQQKRFLDERGLTPPVPSC